VTTINPAIHSAFAGIRWHQRKADAVAHNVANLSTARPGNEAAFVGEGAEVGVPTGTAEGALVYDPSHPLADGTGSVRYPGFDLVDQTPHGILAQRGLEANVAVLRSAQEAYQAILDLKR
jgi:flagellar basal-body rod protein FlgC